MKEDELVFIKFGSEENIKKLFYQGEIYMNSKEYFRRIEDNLLRGDSYEGASYLRNYGPGKFTIPGIKSEINYLNLHLPQYWDEVYGNIYSLTCLSSITVKQPYEEFKLDERLTQFGSHCLFIKDNVKFLQLIEDKLRFLNYKYHLDLVTYFDPKKFNGHVSPFHKPQSYEYQMEYRIYVERDGIDPLSFKIGSLEQIAIMFRSEEIVTGLTLTTTYESQSSVK